MNLKYDIHLSASQISQQTIEAIVQLGFQRDEFANNTRCETTAYHGTYRGLELLPNDSLWSNLCNILDNDPEFIGGLEEEEFDPTETLFFSGRESSFQNIFPKMLTEQPPPNVYKACDIHISIDLEKSNSANLKYLEALEVASFDKPKDGVIHRIFTVTCESIDDGRKAYLIIGDYIKSIGSLIGKMKYEKTVRFYRRPETAYTLPLTNKRSFQMWLNQLELSHAE